MYDVHTKSGLDLIHVLKQLKLKAGRDFHSIKGANAAGKPEHVILSFYDRDKALMFKLQSGIK